MSGPVPQEWTRMIGSLRAAQVAQDTTHSPTSRQADKDEAMVRYCRAVDSIIADLGVLSEQQVLGRITLFLARKERV